MPRIAVVTGEVIGPSMAGPAIRAWRIAEALAGEHDVRLVGLAGVDGTFDDFTVEHADEVALAALEREVDVLVVQGDALSRCPQLAKTDAVVVADLYDPFHLEALEQTRSLPPDLRRRALWASGRAIDALVRRGDLFLCASERQRDFWLGHLAAAGRLNERTYERDPDLRRLLTIVPFGVDDEPPALGAPAIRGVVPGISNDDPILYWGGGIYDWFDPITLLHAVDRLRRSVPDVRLFFAGARHPNPSVGVTGAAAAARACADRLGLTGCHVFFHDWVPHAERGRYLLEADIGVSTHARHLETAFSFRTRVLDYLWASLPVVTTDGDDLARAIDEAGAGIAVPPGDVDRLADALGALLIDPARARGCASAARELGATLRWSEVLAPLVAFCRAPRRAPDLVDPRLAAAIAQDPAEPPRAAVGARSRRVWRDLRRGDLRAIVDRLRVRLSVRSVR